MDCDLKTIRNIFFTAIMMILVTIITVLLFSKHLQYNFALPWSSIHLKQNYLLPSTKHQTLIFKWHCKAWSYQGCAYVRVSISVVPRFIVLIFYCTWCNSGEHFWEIFFETWLKFYGCNCCS